MRILSPAFASFAQAKFDERAELLKPLASTIAAGLARVDNADVAALIKNYYGTLPLTDVFDADFSVFESIARQAVELRTTSPWCRDVDEDIFIHFVATPRVNNEPFVDSWPILRKELAERIAGMSAHDAVLETNYWCCETATYQTADERTLGPLGMLASGNGRCGEESTYLVTALRANGIPARQIYTPLWAHCDDNHAWVEAYVDGEWYYLGACEPEEALNRGWFTAASGRAMLVHTRLFSDYGCDFERDRSILAREGSQVIVNQTAAYGPTVKLTVTVTDEAGKPVPCAYVRLTLVNSAEWGDVAHLITDECGHAQIVIGEGTLRVIAATEHQMADALVDTDECDHVELTLHDVDTAAAAAWRDIDVHAPADHPAPSCPLTPEQAASGRARKHEADQMRTERVAGFVEEARHLANAAGHGKDECLAYYEQAFANAPEVDRFLSVDNGADRVQLLSTLTSKDFRDLTADVLEDHLAGARAMHDAAIAYLEREGAKDDAEELYVKYVLAPRIMFEQLSSFRSYFVETFDATTVEEFRADPRRVWDMICENLDFTASEHVKKLCASPRGAWLSRQGSPVTCRALFVAICRTFGIAARQNPHDRAIEYYHQGAFVAVERAEHTADVTFTSTVEPGPGYFQAWSVARLETSVTVAGTRALGFEALDFWGASVQDGSCTLPLPAGDYRLVCSTRLPNGDTQAAERTFHVSDAGTDKPIELVLREPEASQMLEDIALEAFALCDADGNVVDAAKIAAEHGSDSHPVAISFLEPGMEPTEHLLNELREQAERVAEADLPLVLVISDPAQLDDPTLARTLPTLTGATIRPITTTPEENYKFAIRERVEACINEHTRAILFTNPGNPTGTILTEEELKLMADIAREHDLFVIGDEVYREFVYGGEKLMSLLQLEGYEDNVVVVDSVSKRFSACGARIGCMITRNQALYNNAMKWCQGRLCASTIDQVASAALYTVGSEYFDAVRTEYKARRDTLVEGLKKIPGVIYSEPKGAFYVMAKLPVDDAEKFQLFMLEEFDDNGDTLMFTPAESFYKTPHTGVNEIRMAYVINQDALKRSMELLAKGIEAYNNH